MNLKNRWVVVAGSVLLVGGLLSGAAFAASKTDGKVKAEDRLQQAVQSGKLTQPEAEVMKQLGDLRKAAMEKLKADSKALVDQAVKDGKITQEQADKIGKHDHHKGGHKGRDRDRNGNDGKGAVGDWKKLTPEQLKAKLDEAVKSGKLTQERADKILQRFTEKKAKTQ